MLTGNCRRTTRALCLLAALCLLPWHTETIAADTPSLPSQAAFPLIELPAGPRLALKPYLVLRKAASDTESLQDILPTLDDAPQWHSPLRASDSDTMDIGTDAFWLQLRIHNGTGITQRLWIDQPNAFLKLMKLYVLKQQQVLHQYEAGTTVPSSRWPNDARAMLFPLTVDPGDTLTIVIFNAVTTSIVMHDLTLWESAAYAVRFDMSTATHWMYIGAIGLMILYNLMLFIFTRDRSYMYYVFFAAACCAVLFTGHGYDRWLFWPAATTWNEIGYHITHSIRLIAGLLFAQNFLNLHQKSPRGFWLLNVFMALVAIMQVTQILGSEPTSNAMIGLRFAITLLILLTLWIIVLRLILRRDRSALLYFVAASVYLFTWIATALWILGALPALPMMRNAVVVGQVIELAVLSVALANRINELKQRERAAQLAMQAKSDFLATMSHEIRTPMNGVVSMSDMLMTMNLPAAARQCAAIINSSTMALISVINEILDYSKLEAGKLNLHEEICEPVLAVRDAVILFEAQAAEKRLALNAVIDPDVPQTMRMDVTRLRQILMNLINNAIKFTSRGSIDVHVSRTEKQLVITVSDTGVGMTPEQLKKLFRVYQQANSNVAAHFGGTGLGLAICKELAELMHGDIQASSEPNRGSTFTLRLPLREPQRKPVAACCNQVCVISEDAHYTALLKNWFEKQHVDFCTFDDARALSAWCAHRDTSNLLVLVDTTLASPVFASSIDTLALLNPARLAFLPTIRHAINAQQAQDNDVAIVRNAQHLPRSVISVYWWNALAESSTKAPRPVLPRGKVLIADDDATNRIILEKLLQEMGQDVIMVADGEQALDLFFKRHFDVLIIDCEMPKLDGIAVTRSIRALQKGPQKTPIIALTAHTSPQIATDYMEAGADIILTKPINMERLRSALDGALNKRHLKSRLQTL